MTESSEEMTQVSPTVEGASANPGGRSPIIGRRSLRHRGGLLLWLGAIVLIGVLRWPMLKGSYYKMTDAAVPASTVAWRSDFESAMREAAGSEKRLLVDFSASWCPPCLVMKHDVWPDKGVGEAVKASYIPVLLDPDGAEGRMIAARYRVGSLPTVLVLRGDGTELRRAGYMSVHDLLEFLGDR